jgi:hypothetical protein
MKFITLDEVYKRFSETKREIKSLHDNPIKTWRKWDNFFTFSEFCDLHKRWGYKIL